MTEHWAERDARRLHHRLAHLTVVQSRRLSDAEVRYARRQTLLLLSDEDAELPDGWRESLRELEQLLADIQLERNQEAA